LQFNFVVFCFQFLLSALTGLLFLRLPFQLAFRKWGVLRNLCTEKYVCTLMIIIYCSQLPLVNQIGEPCVDPGAATVRQPHDLPNFPLPSQPTSFCTVLNESAMHRYTELSISLSDSIALEQETREQSTNKLWFNARSGRLTSTSFKRICSRRADHEKLAKSLKSAGSVQTKAMKRGIEQEPIAAVHYTKLTGHQVYPCGFVVNPNAPHLGTSPDRKVIERGSESPNYGLLEIKCPSKNSFTECPYLSKQADGSYKLKECHAHHHQIMGQLGLSGMSWCDFFVKCEEDYHLERIHFDVAKWEQMKCKLDAFFFTYYIMCQ